MRCGQNHPTVNIDPAQIEARVTPRTKAIIPVHLYGQPADMDPIGEIARKRDLKVIEDNAQSIGACYKGRKAGSIGDVGCLSFFPGKNLGCYGDGGMILTDSQEVAGRLRALRTHGGVQKYVSEEQGWNSRLDELQAAVLRVKLRHLDRWNRSRQGNAARYDELLSRLPGVIVPKVAPGTEHVYHQYTIRLSERDRVRKHLAEHGISSMVYYPVPIHLQSIYASLGYKCGDLPEAERASKEVLSLPMYPELTAEQIEHTAKAVARAVQG